MTEHIAPPAPGTPVSDVVADEALAKMIAKAIMTSRIPISHEKQTQQYLAEIFTTLGVLFAREFRLSGADVVDFWVQAADGKGAVLEVKMRRARPADILRQLERYAEHDQVRSLYLITNKAIDLPHRINGKPAYLISLGRAWL
jgi:hypothetical protein